jgi:hypothetical protein
LATKETKPCVDCGKLIPKVQRKSRCPQCQRERQKYLWNKYNRTRLGSPKLFKKLKNGRLIPADYGCGCNENGTYPTKKRPWMNFNLHFDSTVSQPSDQDLVERERIIEEGKEDEEDWTRVMMYNWKNGIDEYEEPPTKKEIYKKWRYWENI